ncbi:MAG: ROK family protein [Actinomycetota bacterium]
MNCNIGIDIGGTKLLGAVVREDGSLAARLETPTSGISSGDVLVEMIEQLQQQCPYGLGAIGLAIAGFVESATGKVAFAPNVREIDSDIRDQIADRFGVSVVTENDANAAAWAEGRLGAAAEAKNFIMLTVGTGVGGGIIINGELYRGANGFAAEFGHMVVRGGEEHLCSCGQAGCLEAVASGTALGRMARRKAIALGGSNSGNSKVLTLAGGDAAAITGTMVGEAAQSGDHFALELLEQLGASLALGLVGLAHAFDPEMIVIGGGVAEVGELFLGPARRALASLFEGTVAPPPVVQAKLGNDAGAIGAALLAGLAGNS